MSCFWGKVIIEVRGGAILRETQISQYYRYTKISQLLAEGQFCRYVGDIQGLKPQIFICYNMKIINLLS